MENSVINWEIIGIIFIGIVGSFFHFLFQLTAYNIIIGAFSAVNESVWEHLKLAFFPLIIFSLIEYQFVKEHTNNFIVAKTIAGYLMPLIIVIIFYSYTALLGTNLLVFDILSFFIAINIGQLVSYKVLLSSQYPKSFIIISWIAIILLAFMFMFFTYYPPHLLIFQDSTNGQYGIVKNHH